MSLMYPVNRQNYLNNYSDYLKKLVLNEELIANIKQFSPVLWINNKDPTNEAIKSFILLELTTTRESGANIIKFLEDSNEGQNKEIANDLKEFYKTIGSTVYGNEIRIEVTPWLSQTDIREPNSINYPMTKRVRGKAFIYNNVPNLVRHESQRFAWIFKKLFFDVHMSFNFTADEIINQLDEVSQQMVDIYDRTGRKDEAFVVIITTHGGDGMICGCDHPSCSGVLPIDPRFKEGLLDIKPITDVVDILAKMNHMEIPKALFFICCQEIEQGYLTLKDKKCWTKDGSDTHADTFVNYSCAEGYETYVHTDNLFTLYGRALSESLALFAHNEDLAQIMNRTNSKLREQLRNAGIDLKTESGKYAPASYMRCPTRKLFFNPGWHMAMDDT